MNLNKLCLSSKGNVCIRVFLGIDWDAIGKVDVLFHQAAINGTRGG